MWNIIYPKLMTVENFTEFNCFVSFYFKSWRNISKQAFCLSTWSQSLLRHWSIVMLGTLGFPWPLCPSPARLLTRTRTHNSLHRLPAQFRVEFKVLLFVFKALKGLALSYISVLLSPHILTRSRRSADHLKSRFLPLHIRLVCLKMYFYSLVFNTNFIICVVLNALHK